MPYTLIFAALHQYDTSQVGITIPVELSNGDRNVELTAKLDTGASFCIFRRDYGEALGLNIESGQEENVYLADGFLLKTYGHNITLSALGFQLDVMVYFAADPNITRNLLGRQGWIQQLRIGIVDYDGKLYISTYDE